MLKVIVYTDGAARGNPGPSASGYSIEDIGGDVISKYSHFNGRQTNNFAEYTAVIKALEWCLENLGENIDVELYSDSELVVRQINGRYKVKAEGIKPLNEKAKELAGKFKSITFKNLPREDPGIAKVDKALNHLLDRRESTGST